MVGTYKLEPHPEIAQTTTRQRQEVTLLGSLSAAMERFDPSSKQKGRCNSFALQ